jgi:arylsulfatase A-like enzyme
MRIGDHYTVGFYVNRYDRGLRYVDSLIGDFVKRLQAAGRLSNTLLVVTSDHGESLGEHDFFGHEVQLYDTLVRVPLVFWYPARLPGGAVWTEPVQLADLAPTILGFLGQTPPGNLDGMDLSSHLLHGTRPRDERVALGSYEFRKQRRFMARSADYKLIVTKGKGEELYDLVADPGETHDLLRGGVEGLPSADAKAAYAELLASVNGMVEVEAARKRGGPLAPLSDELAEQLRALGYLGEDETGFER